MEEADQCKITSARDTNASSGLCWEETHHIRGMPTDEETNKYRSSRGLVPLLLVGLAGRAHWRFLVRRVEIGNYG